MRPILDYPIRQAGGIFDPNPAPDILLLGYRAGVVNGGIQSISFWILVDSGLIREIC
jgi:hypothetical protein